MASLTKLNNTTAKNAGSPSDYLIVHSNLFNPVVDVVNNLTGNGTAQAITGTTGTFSSTLSVSGASTLTGAVSSASSIKSSSATAGVGYATGAGGTVSQGSGSGKATAVTLSKVCGAITMDAAQLNAATIVSFVLTNTAIAATDVLVLNHISGGTVGSYTLNAQCAAGSATINVRNNTAGNLSEALVLQFVVIKGVNA